MIAPERISMVSPRKQSPALPLDRLERVETWGMNKAALAYVYRPTTVDGIRDVFELARAHGLHVGMRGMGRSYGDASLRAEQINLDLSRMNRILDWDPQTGVISVEPGVTVRQLWQYCIEDGWWPPVVPGTMYVSLGGGLGMNYHGKNNFRAGPIGNHVLEFEILLPTGEIKVCNRQENRELFFAAIGGFGMLGCFVRITLQMKHVESGKLRVYAFATRSFGHIIEEFEARMDTADYLVGWIDCFAKGKNLGRGLVHEANYLHAEDDPNPAQSLRVVHQELPDTLFGIVPKSIMWRALRPFANNLGMRLINAAKYFMGSTRGNHKSYWQSHAGFAFLLDYVPDWKFVYKPGGLIQYQSFVPAATAEQCFTAQLETCHRYGMPSYLGVFKRHQRDEFLMSHAVDGYSLALDFPVTWKNKSALWQMTGELNRLVLEAGGRFYFAKDSTLTAEAAATYLGEDTLNRFFALKRACDPDSILQTDLACRLFGARLS